MKSVTSDLAAELVRPASAAAPAKGVEPTKEGLAGQGLQPQDMGARMKRPVWARRLAVASLLTVSLAFTVALAEVVLRFALNPVDFLMADLVEDPVLGYRVLGGKSGHDELGFRNEVVPEKAKVLAFGDSMTYGVMGPAAASWPRQLGGLMKEPVYNLGLGGYGPLQYLELARTHGSRIHSQVWVVGIYLGNDIIDAYNLAHDREAWRAWRLSERPKGSLTQFDIIGAASAPPQRLFAAQRDWLARNSMLYGVGRAILGPLFANEPALDRRAREQNAADLNWSWSDPASSAVNTVFQPGPIFAAQNLNTPEVQEGLKLTQRALLELKELADKRGSQMLLVLIPTKEQVYCPALAQRGVKLPLAHEKLCGAERKMVAELTRFAGENRLALVDTTPALTQKVERGTQVYLSSRDGHMVAAGNEVVARVVSEAVHALPAGSAKR